MTGKPGSLTSTAFQTGVIMERARIIKLLEDYDWFENDYEDDKEILIALIKGETNETRRHGQVD